MTPLHKRGQRTQGSGCSLSLLAMPWFPGLFLQ